MLAMHINIDKIALHLLTILSGLQMYFVVSIESAISIDYDAKGSSGVSSSWATFVHPMPPLGQTMQNFNVDYNNTKDSFSSQIITVQ